MVVGPAFVCIAWTLSPRVSVFIRLGIGMSMHEALHLLVRIQVRLLTRTNPRTLSRRHAFHTSFSCCLVADDPCTFLVSRLVVLRLRIDQGLVHGRSRISLLEG